MDRFDLFLSGKFPQSFLPRLRARATDERQLNTTADSFSSVFALHVPPGMIEWSALKNNSR